MAKFDAAIIRPNDRIIVKKLYKYPVLTARQAKLLLDHFEDYSSMKVALGLLMIQGMRPSELCKLRWHDFDFDRNKEKIIKMRHLVYKPTFRDVSKGTNYYFKQLQKPIWSDWLSKQIIGYHYRNPNLVDKVFPWSTPDALNKQFTQFRNWIKKEKLGTEYGCFVEPSYEVLKGLPMSYYRITLYSLRRFCFTYHYYITFKKDLVELSKFMGHSNPKTTFEHYIQPSGAIGLSEEQISEGVGIDKFLRSTPKNQKYIFDYFKKKDNPRFLDAGQRSLFDWGSD